MALPICTHCEQREGIFMATLLTDGDTQVICGDDLMLYAITLAATLTDGMTLEAADAYSEQLDAIYAHDPRAIVRPAGGRTRKGKAAADDSAQCPVCKQRGGKHSKWCAADPAAIVPAAGGAAPDDTGHSTPAAEHPLGGPQLAAAASVALVPPCDSCGGTTATGDALKLVCNECGNVIATEAADGTPQGDTAT